MRNTMVAVALGFLMAAGGGVALANSNPSSSTSSSSNSSASSSPAKSGSQTAAAPVVFAEEEITSAPFTVERVDKKNRNLVVRAPDGTQSTLDVPAGTPGFESLKKGDNVQLDYFAAAVFGPAGQQANRASQTGSTASGSNQAEGSTSTTHNGRVHNIHKMDNSGSSAHSGNR